MSQSVQGSPDKSLEGRVILITGAYGGLGEAAAKACAKAGASVVLLGRKVPRLNRVYDAVKAVGPEPAIYPLDLVGASPADFEQMAGRINDELGGLHGLLHCAAEFDGLAPLETITPEDFVRSLHVNLTATWLLTQACLPLLRAQADASVVFVSDDPARSGRAYWGVYGIAKQAISALAKMLHDETETGPVRVSTLQPGPMRSKLRARAYMDETATRCPLPEAYAPACVTLLSAAGVARRGSVWTPDFEASH